MLLPEAATCWDDKHIMPLPASSDFPPPCFETWSQVAQTGLECFCFHLPVPAGWDYMVWTVLLSRQLLLNVYVMCISQGVSTARHACGGQRTSLRSQDSFHLTSQEGSLLFPPSCVLQANNSLVFHLGSKISGTTDTHHTPGLSAWVPASDQVVRLGTKFRPA